MLVPGAEIEALGPVWPLWTGHLARVGLFALMAGWQWYHTRLSCHPCAPAADRGLDRWMSCCEVVSDAAGPCVRLAELDGLAIAGCPGWCISHDTRGRAALRFLMPMFWTRVMPTRNGATVLCWRAQAFHGMVRGRCTGRRASPDDATARKA